MYRLFEILPGALAWTTLFLMVLLSWKTPLFIAVFIILFDIYWLLKTVYLSLHLRATFTEMRRVMAADWLAKIKAEPNRAGRAWQDVYHLIVLPMYKEPYEVVRESFGSLLRSNYPRDKFFIVLATEARAGAEARMTAERLRTELAGQFGDFIVTSHPADRPGELAGKGSNEVWATQEAKRLIVDQRRVPYENVLVSVFDVDTQVFPEYFGRLTYVFLNAPNRLRAIYQPVPLFTNNIYQAPALARVVSFSSTFWQMMQQARPERLTSFSSQSVPLPVILDIGYWQKDVVSEDSRVFWQGYLRYRGDFRCEPLVYPVSMDANVAPTFWRTMLQTYKQHRRWAWGSENVAYLLDGFRRDTHIPFRKKLYWGFTTIEGYHSWATNALMIFALGWLPVMIGGHAFNQTMLSYNLPQITRFIITLSMIGVATSAILALVLLPPRPKWFGARHRMLYFIQWFLMPITLIVFGCIPALEAQTRLMLSGRFRLGFWVTPKGRFDLRPKGPAKI